MTTTIDIATFVSAATVAFALSASFLLLSNLWVAIARRFRVRRRFQDQILFEAGQALRRQVTQADASIYRYMTAIAIFCVCLGTLLVLGRRDWFAELPIWGWALLGVGIIGAMAYYTRELFLLIRSRFQLAYLRDANIALGHGLLHSIAKGNRVFHSVPVNGEIIDNIVVGANGIYAVNVIAPPKQLAKTVRLETDSLVFEPGDDEVSLNQHRNKIKSLARELTPVVGHTVKILSVVGVPGCQVMSTGTDQHLVVNERNCVMLTGWRVPDAYLMGEEVEKISDFLLKRCRRGKASQSGKKRSSWRGTGIQFERSLKVKS